MITMMMMIARVLLTLAIHSCVVSASVMETTENYYCKKGSQALKSENATRDIDCEQSWTAKSIPIGNYESGSDECHSPCINVTAGEMIISGCVNATLTVICSQQHLTEYRIHFVGIQLDPLPQMDFKERHHYGIWACLALLLLTVVGFAISAAFHRHRLRNTGTIQF